MSLHNRRMRLWSDRISRGSNAIHDCCFNTVRGFFVDLALFIDTTVVEVVRGNLSRSGAYRRLELLQTRILCKMSQIVSAFSLDSCPHPK